MLIIIALATVAAVYVLYWIQTLPSNFPPGPPRLPLVGSTPWMPRRLPHLKMEVWRTHYGPVVGLLLGPKMRAVAFCSPDVVMSVLQHPDFQGRPDTPFYRQRTFNKRLGILFTDGPFWTEQRRFTVRHLRDFGFGKMSMEAIILQEVEELLDVIRNKTLQVSQLFNAPLGSTLWHIVAGHPLRKGDPQQHRLLEGIAAMLRAGVPTSVSVRRLFPALARLAPHLTGLDMERRIFNDLASFMRETIEAHKKTLDKDNPRDLIDMYLSEILSAEGSSFTEEGLIAVLFDLFGGGTETTATSLSFAMLYMILYPEIQKKVQKELDDILGNGRRISLGDRLRLPYLEAVISEIFRITPVAPLTPPHATLKDTEFNGYTIPKGTTVFVNLWSVLHDENHWGDPDVFRPERFIDEETKCFKKDPWLINFSAGSRICPGQPLARDTMFLFFGAILQEMNVTLPSGDEIPSTDPVPGLTLTPKPFRIMFTSRF